MVWVMGRATAVVSFADVQAAAGRLVGVAHRTPVMTSRGMDARVGARVFFKCENFQRVGAFKFRGAFNALSKLEPAARERGVVTYSSGNHAQAIALAAAITGVRAVIVMPQDAPGPKLEATRRYLERAPAQSEVVLYDRAGGKTREQIGRELADTQGLTIIPPYDHPDIIAGQGTAAMELFEAVGELDYLFVPCGGGGLLSGCAIAAAAMSPVCKVIGVEPETADDATRSFQTGKLVTIHEPPTICDGARTPSLGKYTFEIVLSQVAEMMTVSDAQVVEAMRFLWERMKLVVEPTGALSVAGAFAFDHQGLVDQRVGVLLSGGNVDLDRLGQIFGI